MAFSNTFVTLNDVSIDNLGNVAGQVVVVANDGLSVSVLPRTSLTGYTGSIGVGYTGSQGNVGYTGSQGDGGYTGSAASNYWRTFRTPGANIVADQPEDVITFAAGTGINLDFSESSDTITWRPAQTSIASGSNVFIVAPAASAFSISAMLGASRISSVFGLNERPHSPIVRPDRSVPNRDVMSSNNFCF